MGRDRGRRPAGQPPHRRDPAQDAVPEQQRRRRHDGQRRLVPRAVRQVRRSPASWIGIRSSRSAGSRAGSPGCPRPCRTPSTCWPPTGTCSITNCSTTVRYYWDHRMSASFMVDPLGLRLIDQIGVDKVMWSSDYPHNESTFGVLGEVAGHRRGGGRPRGRPSRSSSTQHPEVPGTGVSDRPTQTGVTQIAPNGLHAARHSRRARPRPDAARGRCASARRDGRAGRRRAGAARQRQRHVRHRHRAGRWPTRACRMWSGRSRSCWPTMNTRTCSCRSVRVRRWKRSCPTTTSHGPGVSRIRRGRRGIREDPGRPGARRCDDRAPTR